MELADGRKIAHQYPDIDGGVYPHTGTPAVDSHWVIEPGTSYMMGYISRHVPVSLLENISEAIATFQTLIDNKVGVGLDLKKATGMAGGPPNTSVFGNCSYNPAARSSAAMILPSVTAGGYFPGLPETRTTLTHVLATDTGRAGRINCTAAAVSAMTDAEMRACWTNYHKDLRTIHDDYYERVAPAIRAAFPAAGYLNEADYFEKEWQRVFWGENYLRLLTIKHDVDPTGLFVCHHCVGSEDWSPDGNCRLRRHRAKSDDDSSTCVVADIASLDQCIEHIAAGAVLSMQLTATLDCPDGVSHACMDLTAPRSAPLMVTGSAGSAAAGLYRSNYSQPLLDIRGGRAPDGQSSLNPSALVTVIRRLTFEDAVWPSCYPKLQPPGPSQAMVIVQAAAGLIVENCTFLRAHKIGINLGDNYGVAFTGNVWLESQTFGIWTGGDTNSAVNFFGNSFLRGKNNAIIGVLSDSVLQGNTFVYNHHVACFNQSGGQMCLTSGNHSLYSGVPEKKCTSYPRFGSKTSCILPG